MRGRNPFYPKLLCVCLIASWCFACRHQPIVNQQPKISFSTSVMPIIAGNCGAAGCHIAGSDIQLAQYDDLFKDDYVVKYQPFSSKIYHTITSQNKNTVMPVPPQKPLNDAQIRTIYIWILEGAQNN